MQIRFARAALHNVANRRWRVSHPEQHHVDSYVRFRLRCSRNGDTLEQSCPRFADHATLVRLAHLVTPTIGTRVMGVWSSNSCPPLQVMDLTIREVAVEINGPQVPLSPYTVPSWT